MSTLTLKMRHYSCCARLFVFILLGSILGSCTSKLDEHVEGARLRSLVEVLPMGASLEDVTRDLASDGISDCRVEDVPESSAKKLLCSWSGSQGNLVISEEYRIELTFQSGRLSGVCVRRFLTGP